jgi:hypothetical protein
MELAANEEVEPRVQRAIALLLSKDSERRPKRARDVAALFAMLEKDLAQGRDIESDMARIVAERVGPQQRDDETQSNELADRAKHVLGADYKLQTTGVADLQPVLLTELDDAAVDEEVMRPRPVTIPGDIELTLPRFGTPPATPAEALSYYARLLASLERRPKT